MLAGDSRLADHDPQPRSQMEGLGNGFQSIPAVVVAGDEAAGARAQPERRLREDHLGVPQTERTASGSDVRGHFVVDIDLLVLEQE